MFVHNVVTLTTNRLVTSLLNKTVYARFVSIASASSTAKYLFPWALVHRPQSFDFCSIYVNHIHSEKSKKLKKHTILVATFFNCYRQQGGLFKFDKLLHLIKKKLKYYLELKQGMRKHKKPRTNKQISSFLLIKLNLSSSVLSVR